jgi:hypothetical protein
MAALVDPATKESPLPHSGDPKFAHLIDLPPHAITEAYAFGTPLEAMCGHVFVPTRDPYKFPFCPTCKKLLLEQAKSV